eukprot:SM001229S25731  [mRNA]  locus=s1229:483:1066:+ [translate_table: standard]
MQVKIEELTTPLAKLPSTPRMPATPWKLPRPLCSPLLCNDCELSPRSAFTSPHAICLDDILGASLKASTPRLPQTPRLHWQALAISPLHVRLPPLTSPLGRTTAASTPLPLSRTRGSLHPPNLDNGCPRWRPGSSPSSFQQSQLLRL